MKSAGTWLNAHPWAVLAVISTLILAISFFINLDGKIVEASATPTTPSATQIALLRADLAQAQADLAQARKDFEAERGHAWTQKRRVLELQAELATIGSNSDLQTELDQAKRELAELREAQAKAKAEADRQAELAKAVADATDPLQAELTKARQAEAERQAEAKLAEAIAKAKAPLQEELDKARAEVARLTAELTEATRPLF